MIPKEITSLQHPLIKTFVKLRTSRKFRYENQQVVISGKKHIQEAKNIDLLLTTKKDSLNIPAKQKVFVTEAILKKVTGLEHPEPIAAIVKMPNWDPLKGKQWLLALDTINDPGNLGTLLRTAYALGWEGTFLIDTCVDPYNDKALRAAKGATFSLPLQMGTYEELFHWIEEEKLFPWVGDVQGKPVNEVPSHDKIVLILGNEASGVNPLIKKKYDTISIPIKNIESLNVSVAGAILMYTLKS